MSDRHSTGLTLIEVLASLVLLAMTSTVCVSLLRDARAQTEAVADFDADVQFDLGMLADSVITDPTAFDVELNAETPVTLTWPSHFQRVGTIQINVVTHEDHLDEPPSQEADDKDTQRRVWLEFTSNGASVARWAMISLDDAGDSTP